MSNQEPDAGKPKAASTIGALSVRPEGESSEYEIYAPPGSYDPKIQAGRTKLLVLEVRPNQSRHDDYVAHIARLSSEDMSRKFGVDRTQIFVREGSPTRSEHSESQEDKNKSLNSYDVINYSGGVVAANIFSIMSSSLGGTNPASMFEGVSRPIVVQAVGNHGRDGDQLNRTKFDLDTSENSHFYRHTITVGEATRDPKSGMISIDEHSAKSGPTFVASNPSDTGAKYLFYDDITELTPEARAKLTIDKDGYVAGIQGTSFSAPNVSGALASAKEAFPILSNAEIIAAAVASARIPKGSDPQETTLTPSGLDYGTFKWGFGMFDPDRFKKQLIEMNDIKTTYGANVETSETQTGFKRGVIDRNGQVYHSHSFKIDGDSTVQKISLMSQMPLMTKPADHVILIHPSGKEIEIPTSIGGGITRFTTEAFMGADAKGEWKVLMPGESRIAVGEEQYPQIKREGAAFFTIHGVSKGEDGQSNIGRLFEREVQARKLELDVTPQAEPSQRKVTPTIAPY